MEAIHQVIDGRVLNTVVTLPKPMQNMLVEIIITPAKKQPQSRLTRRALRAKLQGSHTEALSGSIKANENKTLDEYRAERRAKYERVN